MNWSKISLFLRLSIGGIFLVAAISKFINPYPFGDFVNSLAILPSEYIIPAVYFFSTIEFLASLFVIINYKSYLVVFILFLGIFSTTVYLAAHFYFNMITANVQCGCFGGFLDRKVGSTKYFLSNGILAAVMLFYLWKGKKAIF